MKMNPSRRLCEIARMMTKSQATNEQITKELASMTKEEWSEQCGILDRFFNKYNISFYQRWEWAHIDFCNIAAANDVDEATLLIAYMEWLRTPEAENLLQK